MKNIAATIIFDGAALNRDEKIGGNIQSIKKLNVEGSLKSFISRPAIRHYLFNTLVKAHPGDWKPAKVTGQGTVAQFDITEDDIFSSAELDAFGYMFTIEKEMSITRKSPVGITKAISISNYNQDMVFYANHDLVQRANQDGLNITPNPFQREEHQSLYKLSFTIDTEIFGKDVWVVKNEPKYKNSDLTIELAKPASIFITNADEKEIEDEQEKCYSIKKNNKEVGVIYINDKLLTVSKDLMEEKSEKKKGESEGRKYLQFKTEFIKEKKSEKEETEKEDKENQKKKKGKKPNIKIEDYESIQKDDSEYYTFSLTRIPEYDLANKELKLETGIVKNINNAFKISDDTYEIKENNKKFGTIKIENINNAYKITFELDDAIKKKRIKQILDAIHNGLVSHSSGEDNTIVPLFMIAGEVIVPSPVFHSYIDVVDGKIIGLNDCLNNSWLSGNVSFILKTDRLKAEVNNNNITNDWSEFICKLGLGE